MHITKINSFNNTYSKYNQQNTNTNDNLNFGFKFPRLRKDTFVTSELKDYIKLFTNEISINMNVNPQRVEKYITPLQPERMKFFKALSDKITVDMFTHKIDIPENAFEQIEELYKLIPKPDKLHIDILNNSSYTFKDSTRLLNLAQKDKNNYNLIKQLMTVKRWDAENLNIQFRAQDIIDIVNSKDSEKLNKNFDNYKSYIALNYNKPNFVKNFIEELSKEDNISTKHFDKKLAVTEVKNSSLLLKQLPDELIENNWNKEGFELVSQNDIPLDYLVSNSTITDKKALDFYEYLIKSTTKDNKEDRILLFKIFTGFSTEGNNIEVLTAVLNRIDNDKNFKKIFNKVAQNSYTLTHKPLTELMYYCETFGSDVLAKKADKFIRITNGHIGTNTKPEQIAEILSKNLNNKYYITSSGIDTLRQNEAMKRMTAFFFPETKAGLMRIKRKFQYEIMPKIFGTGKPVEIKQKIPYEDFVKAFNKSETNIPHRIPDEQLPAPLDLSMSGVDLTTLIQQTPPEPKIKIKRDYKAQKLLIQQDAQEIIKSRMKSAKQIQEQIGIYTKKATKIRNQFLNEMFDSVAETRAQERAKGIKHPRISNADVLEVYQKINGQNKNIFKYLLTKLTKSGEREFNLKQISQILDDVKKNRPPKKILSEK